MARSKGLKAWWARLRGRCPDCVALPELVENAQEESRILSGLYSDLLTRHEGMLKQFADAKRCLVQRVKGEAAKLLDDEYR